MIRSSTRCASRPKPARRRFRLVMTLLAFSLQFGASSALAQHPGAAGTAPPPPPGNGVLTVQVEHARGAGTDIAAGISIALYALGPDGNPGFVSGETDAQGTTVFRGISANPDIVYLIGAHFEGIPFGERVTFEPGQTTARVEIEISSPTDRVAGVEVEELRARLDWLGDRIVVNEILRVLNPGNQVILIPEQDRSRAIVVRPLPQGATNFSAGATSIGDGLGLEDGQVRFFGPLYPGEQRVEYQYSLPITAPGGTLAIMMREAMKRVVVVAGTDGIEVEGRELIASSSVASDAGQPLAAWARTKLAAGERLDVAIELPSTRHDHALVTIPRNDIWIELDDARLTATVDIKLLVAEGSPVSGTTDTPLFHVSLPAGASLNGVAPEAEALGLIPTAEGGFDVVGPIGAGETSLGYSYQMPVDRGGVDLQMRFPREVGTLNVLIADTELELDSSRLHRRRPFRSGTRNYLHREAYHVSADEIVDLRVIPLQGGGIPRAASGALTLVALAGGVFFMIMPLISASRRETEIDVDWQPIRAEREAIYVSIRDLDHDFETGKLESEDYQPMREALRERAIELLRMERKGKTDSSAPVDEPSPPTATAGGEVTTAAYCPGCGGRVQVEWRFCTHCGGKLNPPSEGGG
jgi:hypothetical protein